MISVEKLRGWWLPLIVLMLSVQVFVTNWRLNALVERINQSAQGRATLDSVVKVGSKLTPVTANSVRSNSDSLLTFKTVTLLFIVSPRCEPCTSSLPHFESINNKISSDADVFMLSAAPTNVLREYAETNRVTQDLHSVGYSWMAQSGFSQTPTVTLVSPGGRVEHVWIGRLTDETVDQIVATTKSMQAAL